MTRSTDLLPRAPAAAGALLIVLAACLPSGRSAASSPAGADRPAHLEQSVPGTPWIVVVAEGRGEPRSIGSYTLRTYSEPEPGRRFDRFVAGLVRPRDGAVEAIRLADLDRDGAAEIVVTLRSVGTGGYLSADAFRLRDGVPRWVASVEGLPPDEDPMPALAAAVRSRTP